MAHGPQGYRFGTFKGVFTPSILTILGVIMYLRFPWVLGSVGLGATLLIVTLSVSITLLTGLSISAMATNMRVGGGGAYYMISRTLGLEAGAAVGLPLFLAQSLGVAFYIAGFSETVAGYVPAVTPLQIGVVTLVVLTALAYVSADLALKTQYVILALLALSLVSLFLGGPPAAAEPRGAALPALPFWATFAVFFPAVTGIEAGLGMSGDLANPARALPRGTLLAVLTGYAIYVAIPVFVDSAVPDPEMLLGDSLIITRIARWPSLVLLGIIGASLSSAMGALLGAPRTLQALAQDAVLPRVLGRGFGAANEPRLAIVVAFVIALLGLLLGDLNAIAPVLSMFFLTSYAMLNFSAGLEGLIGGPAWRPEFRVRPWVSLAGGVACVAAMFMIDPGATFVAMFICGLVYHSVQSRQLTAQWGDVRYGALVLVARLAIEGLSRRRLDARSWSPNVLVLAGVPSTRWHLVVIARALAGDAGLLTVATVVREEREGSIERAVATHAAIEGYLEDQRLTALVKVQTDRDVLDGLISLVKSYGFGPLVPNTVLLGQAETPDDPVKHAELLSQIQENRKNLVVMHEGRGLPALAAARRIDLWWRGDQANLGFMLALAFLLRKHPVWASAAVRLWRIVDAEEAVAPAGLELAGLLASSRLPATHTVLVHRGDPFDVMHERSQGADLVFLGLRRRHPGESYDDYAAYYAEICRHTKGLPPTALVTAAGTVDLHRLFRS